MVILHFAAGLILQDPLARERMPVTPDLIALSVQTYDFVPAPLGQVVQDPDPFTRKVHEMVGTRPCLTVHIDSVEIPVDPDMISRGQR